MRILFIGDVVSQSGCETVRRILPKMKKEYQIDFCIINGENSAVGNGITPESAKHLFTSGADAVTTGNHVLRRSEVYSMLDEENTPLLRPLNFHRACPGRGSTVLEKGSLRLGIANLIGSVYMDNVYENPFDAIDNCLRAFDREGVKCRLVDFHAEATGEKRGMGFYLDGRVSAVVGTHTHVLTADAQILPNGTAYITDVGMTGVKQSVLGVKSESVLQKMRTGLPARFEAATGKCTMNCAVITIDNKSGKAQSIESYNIE